jgi:hypothetical protein
VGISVSVVTSQQGGQGQIQSRHVPAGVSHLAGKDPAGLPPQDVAAVIGVVLCHKPGKRIMQVRPAESPLFPTREMHLSLPTICGTGQAVVQWRTTYK